MKPPALVPAVVSALVALHAAAVVATANPRVSEHREGDVWVRTVIHEDGSYTVSKKDGTVEEITKWTMSASDTLIMRSVFQIDNKGNYLRGHVFDARGRLLYVSEFIYDNRGRKIEERVVNARGVPVRRLIFAYDRFGRARPFNISFANGAASTPVAVNDAERYSSTNDKGFQRDPRTIPRAQKVGEDDATDRARLFKRSAKKRYRDYDR